MGLILLAVAWLYRNSSGLLNSLLLFGIHRRSTRSNFVFGRASNAKTSAIVAACIPSKSWFFLGRRDLGRRWSRPVCHKSSFAMRSIPRGGLGRSKGSFPLIQLWLLGNHSQGAKSSGFSAAFMSGTVFLLEQILGSPTNSGRLEGFQFFL